MRSVGFRALLLLLLPLPCTALPAQGVTLRDLPELARARAERQRPAQLARLEPFLADLDTEYLRNATVLDGTLERVAALGSDVVPILIEFLTPDSGENRARWRADNASRILLKLEPALYIDTWIDLLDGPHAIGRRAALRLLGAAGPDPRTTAAIARNFGNLREPYDRRRAIAVAADLGIHTMAEQAVPMLEESDAESRRTALEYLTQCAYRDAVPTAVSRLQNETEKALLPAYIGYFLATVEQDADVATALVGILGGSRLGVDDQRTLVEGLARIAPKNHEPTEAALLAILERGETGPLGIAAAVSLQTLDEKRGIRVLFETLEARIRDRRGDAGAIADRADAYFAFGRHKEAIRDYEDAIRLSFSGTRRSAYHLQVARCEAHRDSMPRMLRSLKSAELSAATIRAEAAKDPVFREMLEKEAAQRFLESLDR
ncbi:MAG: HEAT repeat domain-containing protein [Planctomycetota bacterium]